MRAIVNVATGKRYLNGQKRLQDNLMSTFKPAQRPDFVNWLAIPQRWPTHQAVPYGFKAHAMAEAGRTFSTLLWCDSSIMLGTRPLEDLWQKIEQDGYWISKNGDWNNYQWTADAADPDLFPACFMKGWSECWGDWARGTNRGIQHVIAGAFGISLEHPTGRAILEEYLRLAKTKAFCGPWRTDWTKCMF